MHLSPWDRGSIRKIRSRFPFAFCEIVVRGHVDEIGGYPDDVPEHGSCVAGPNSSVLCVHPPSAMQRLTIKAPTTTREIPITHGRRPLERPSL